MRVTMIKTTPGADDRVTVRTYCTGQTYDLGAELAHEFLTNGQAVEATPAPAPEPAPPPEPRPPKKLPPRPRGSTRTRKRARP